VTAGTYHVNFGKEGKARIQFQDNGVARIQADSREIATYSLGFVHARDRRWQMEYLKRLSQGRMSEIFGNLTLPLDQNFRTFQIRKICREIDLMDNSEARFYLEYYARGVNDYSRNHTLPLQFKLFGLEHEDWTFVDSCSVLHLMSFLLSGDWGFEFLRDYLSAVLDDEEFVKEMMSYHHDYTDNSTIPIINDDELKDIGFFKFNKIKEETNVRHGNITHYATTEVLEMIKNIKEISIEGSNAWAVSGEHTKNGLPLIVNDPHLGNGMPSLWHYSEIEFPDNSFISGATVPGLPSHAIFVTDKIGNSFSLRIKVT
jgi:penicillin G amidase